MNFSDENTTKKINRINNESKDYFLKDFNKKLDYITNNSTIILDNNNKIDKNNNNENKQNKDTLTINPIDEIFTIKNNKINNENYEILNKQNEKGIKRLKLYKLYDDDSLSYFFSFNSPNKNESINLNNIIYKEGFNDKELEKDSIFYLVNNYNDITEKGKNQSLNLEEIKQMKKNEIYLNFGEDPLDVLFKIKNSKNKEKKNNLQFFANYLSSLNKFNIQDPNIILKENRLIYINQKDEINMSGNDLNNNNISPNNNLFFEPNPIKENSNTFNNLKVPVLADISIKNLMQKNKEEFKKPVINEKYEFLKNNKCTNNIIVKNIIKNDICNKYKVNINEKNKINELLKEYKFEFKHKKMLFNRGKIIKNDS